MKYLEILRAKLAEMEATRNGLVDELEAITTAAATEERSELNAEETTRFEQVKSEIDVLDAKPTAEDPDPKGSIPALRSRIAQLDEIEQRRETGEQAVPQRDRTGQKADPFDLRDVSITSGGDLRSRAIDAVAATGGDLDDAHRARATELLERRDTLQGVLARRILATGSPAYRSAFLKMAGGAGNLLTDDERQAVVRAQSLVNADGGFAVPFTLDPTIIMTNDGAANPFRQVSRVETIVTDTWNGVSSAGVTGGYAAEASEVDDDSATLGQPSVKPERWDVFVPFSFEIGQDWQNLESDVRMMVNERRDEFDVVAFTSGSGADEPEGIITGLAGTASEVAPLTAETFAVADVYNLTEQLPPKYRRTAAQAKWMQALGTLNTIRQFADDDGHALLARIGAGSPAELLGHETFENSAMDSATNIDPAATADHFVLILGDWRNFLIVDRAGMNMELVPHLFGDNNRPTGQRGFLAWGRTGAGVLNINAFRVLNVATTA